MENLFTQQILDQTWMPLAFNVVNHFAPYKKEMNKRIGPVDKT